LTIERFPTGFTLHQKSRVMEIAFSDGRSFRLPYVGKRNVEIRTLEPVGSYAVPPQFSDGHNTGIYSWDYQLAAAGASRE
jgi:DUF971 family protein